MFCLPSFLFILHFSIEAVEHLGSRYLELMIVMHSAGNVAFMLGSTPKSCSAMFSSDSEGFSLIFIGFH